MINRKPRGEVSGSWRSLAREDRSVTPPRRRRGRSLLRGSGRHTPRAGRRAAVNVVGRGRQGSSGEWPEQENAVGHRASLARLGDYPTGDVNCKLHTWWSWMMVAAQPGTEPLCGEWMTLAKTLQWGARESSGSQRVKAVVTHIGTVLDSAVELVVRSRL